MNASFAPYSATLQAEPVLRHGVLASGTAFALAGAAMLAALPADVRLIVPAFVAWVALATVELTLARRAYGQCRTFTLCADGSLDIGLADGSRWGGRLAPGTLEFTRSAWLCIRVPGRATWGEPLSRRGQDREQWRRFQVICRHMSA